MGFDELIKRYPDDQLALGAKYWKGENYLSQEKFDDAISEFDGVILSSGSGDTDEARKAKFKKALIYIKLSQNDKAISLFDEIIKKYPLTQEAVQAKEKKASLSNQ
jgi:TolA-binding protein